MAESVKTNSPADTSALNAEGQTAPFWQTVSFKKWLGVIVCASLVIHAVVFLFAHKSTGSAAVPGEFTIGVFTLPTGEHGDLQAPGKFTLHIRLIDDFDSLGRQRLATHQFRVREAVEGLLRKSKGLDWDDTAVARFKHEIQERIDNSIDLRAVAEVIITDLNLPNAKSTPAAVEY